MGRLVITIIIIIIFIVIIIGAIVYCVKQHCIRRNPTDYSAFETRQEDYKSETQKDAEKK